MAAEHTRVRGIIFDLDGTLLDTLADLTTAVNTALAGAGHPAHPASAVRGFIGDGVQALARRALPAGCRDQATVARTTEAVRQAYGQAWDRQTRLYPGVAAALDELSRQRIPLAVLSNKPHDFTEALARRFLGRWPLVAAHGASPGVPLKPDPAAALGLAGKLGLAPAELALVGDSEVDIQTAVAAGMLPVGVTWGFRDQRQLRSAGAEVLLRRPQQILALV